MLQSARSLALGLVLTSFSLTGLAENTTHAGSYTIHHQALATGSLTPQIASAYGIQASKSRGLLNVAVLKDEPGTAGTPVKAQVRAVARDRTGQVRDIPMREVMDGEAIYYLGVLRIQDQETLTFNLEVKPLGSQETFTATLSQQFVTQ
jgi:hypothetical protein